MIEGMINSPTEGADVVIMSAGYDRTSSLRKGASQAPAAILKCFNEDVEFYDRYTRTQPHRLHRIAHQPIDNINELTPMQMVEKVRSEFAKVYGRAFPILLGGEHSVTIGSLLAISQVADVSQISIVSIDAHFDLRDDDDGSNPNETTPTPFAHCCAMRRAREMGFPVLVVGVRSYDEQELRYAKENEILFLEWGLTTRPAIDEVIAGIRTESVYLSIDLDGIDPAHLPAVGCPVPGGIEWGYAIALCRTVIQQRAVRAIDIVELCPREHDIVTEFAAAQLCHVLMSAQLHRKGKV